MGHIKSSNPCVLPIVKTCQQNKKTNIRYVSRGRTKRIRKSFFSLIIVIACDTQSPRVLPNHHLVLLSYYKFHEDACQQEINLSSQVNSFDRSAIPMVLSWDGGGRGWRHIRILKSGLEKIPRNANDSSFSLPTDCQHTCFDSLL